VEGAVTTQAEKWSQVHGR